MRQGKQAVALWDALAQRPVTDLPAHGRRYCKALACSSKGSLLAWGNRDANKNPVVSLRDVSTQRDLAPLPHPDRVAALAFSPDASVLATLACDGVVRLWDLESRQVRTQFVTARVSLRPDRFGSLAELLVNPTADAAVERKAGAPRVPAANPWLAPPAPDAGGEGKAGDPTAQARYRGSTVFTDHYGVVLFSPDGRLLAVGEGDPRIRLLDRVTGKEQVIPLPLPADGISALAFSPDSRWLAAACGAMTNEVLVWDWAAGTPAVRLAGHVGWVVALAFSPDGHTLASASADQTVRLWDPARQVESRRLLGNTDEVWALAWTADGKSLVSGARDGSVRYWDVATKPADPYEVLPEAVHLWSPAFLPDSRSFLTTARADGAVARCDTATLQEGERLALLGSNHTSLGLSPDGRWLALGDAVGHVQMWDFPVRRVVTNLVFAGGNVFALWFCEHGSLLVGGAFKSDGGIAGKLWRVAG